MGALEGPREVELTGAHCATYSRSTSRMAIEKL